MQHPVRTCQPLHRHAASPTATLRCSLTLRIEQHSCSDFWSLPNSSKYLNPNMFKCWYFPLSNAYDYTHGCTPLYIWSCFLFQTTISIWHWAYKCSSDEFLGFVELILFFSIWKKLNCCALCSCLDALRHPFLCGPKWRVQPSMNIIRWGLGSTAVRITEEYIYGQPQVATQLPLLFTRSFLIDWGMIVGSLPNIGYLEAA